MSHPDLITKLPEYLEGPIGIDTETKDLNLKTLGPGWAFDSGDDYVAGVSICCDNLKGYISLRHPDSENMDNGAFWKWLDYQLCRREDQPKVFANAGYDLGWFRKYGVRWRGPLHDVLVQVPLLNEHHSINSYNLDSVALRELGSGKDLTELEAAAARIGVPAKDAIKNLWRFKASEAAAYATKDAADTLAIWKKLSPQIVAEDLTQVYDLEMSLTEVFLQMRMTGVRVDLDRADQLRTMFRSKQKEAGAELKRITGIDITDHPWAVGPIAQIMDDLGIEYPLTPKTKKPSIKGDWLDKLDHPVAKLIGTVRDYDRAAGTFIDSYIFGHQHKGRIHGSFNQLKVDGGGTLSGRLSSNKPNLQNIPARDADIGLLIREAWVPEIGQWWLSGDYSSQEPRWTVHFAAAARCAGGADAARRYNENPRTDYHQMVADLCGIERKPAKIINLGLAYGMGGYKLCLSLGLPTEMLVRNSEDFSEEVPLDSERGQELRSLGNKSYLGPGKEGRDLIRRFHENAPFIRALNKKCQKQAREKGFIRTILGRRCRFPIVGGERWYLHTAMNRLIQGSSADQTKKSLRMLYDAGYCPLLSVHDENCFSIDNDEKYIAAIKEIMENCIENTYVPFIVDPKIGKNWGECK
jgi:DNA polymerase I-like protein with 3'-5' exonuclease and polymerase domains